VFTATIADGKCEKKKLAYIYLQIKLLFTTYTYSKGTQSPHSFKIPVGNSAFASNTLAGSALGGLTKIIMHNYAHGILSTYLLI